MADDEAFVAMMDACIAAGEAVMKHGTPEMRAAMRTLLYCIGREIVRREQADKAARQDGSA